MLYRGSLNIRLTFGYDGDMVIPREPLIRGHRRDYTQAPIQISKAYLLGALHDGTERRLTFRICQKSEDYIDLLARGIRSLGGNAWIYKEGKTRRLYVVEFSKSFLAKFSLKTEIDKIDYIRGYFDAEGGIARTSKVRYYLYFAQKNLFDLLQVRNYLMEQSIVCGIIHNPSKKVDPNYWRFYVNAKSYKDFAKKIGSWHPEKSLYLRG